MFEKDARFERDARVYVSGLFPYINDFEYEHLIRAYQDGAEFGYNKTNEWHYVKDGDLPKDDNDMLMSGHLILLTKLKGTDDLYVTLGRYNFLTQEFCYQHIVGLIDVVAWQEIVLPKEKE